MTIIDNVKRTVMDGDFIAFVRDKSKRVDIPFYLKVIDFIAYVQSRITTPPIVLTTQDALYEALPTDDVILTDSNITLYEGEFNVKVLTIKNRGLQDITITPNGAETIEGFNNALLNSLNSYTLVFDGISNWEII